MTTLHHRNHSELEAFITRLGRSLADQANELRWSTEPGDVRAAMDTTLGVLAELRDVRPEQHAAIDSLILQYSAS